MSYTMGEVFRRFTKFWGIYIPIDLLGSIASQSQVKKDCWNNLVEFLTKEVKFQEEIILNNRLFQEDSKKSFIKKKSYDDGDKRSYNSNIEKEKKITCFLCGENDHTVTVDHFGRNVIQYFSCKTFVDMAPKERFKLLLKKGLCYQCLAPGAPVDKGKHSDASCYNKFVCKNRSHSKYPRKLHVLLCEEHKNDASNVELLDKYKKENIYNLRTPVPQFTKQIKLSFVCNTKNKTEVFGNRRPDPSEVVDSSVYILQTIVVKNQKLNIFFDSGCGDLVSKKEAISKLEEVGKASLVIPGPIVLGGIGNLKTESSHGVYKVELTMADGNSAIMSGVCLDRITSKFPTYPLNGKVQEDIAESYKSAGYNPENLPKLPESVGGETDLMIGIKYLKYFPEAVFRLPSGLTIYESPFLSTDGTRGVVGGPHQVFTMIERHYCCDTFTSLGTYFVQQVMLVRMGYQVNPDVELLCFKEESVEDIYDEDMEKLLNSVYYHRKPIKDCKRFEIAENAGSEITYRCNDCRDCKNCKKNEQIEFISIQEEIEQDIINKSVFVDIENRLTIARLPFIEDPLNRLLPNKHKALAVYKSQLRKLERSPVDKNDVIKSEKKLQDLAFVDFIENLTVKLNKGDIETIQRESLRPECIIDSVNLDSEECESDLTSSHLCRKLCVKKLEERYKFLDYIIDPNKFRLRKVVRVLALVMLFIRKLKQKSINQREDDLSLSVCNEIQIPEAISGDKYVVTSGHCFRNDTKLICKPGLVVILTDTDLKKAFEYFYKKSTLELIKFVDKQSYKNITEMKNNILYYTGRILPSQVFGGNISMSDVIVDLTASKFVVPVIDSSSPLAFSIVNEVHWYDPVAKHSGNETVLRYTMKYAHIIECS